jgi:hypothetical protein
MGIRVVDPPIGLARSLAKNLHAVGSARHGTRSSTFSLAAPHPVFHLSRDAIRSGGGFETATMSGWKFFVVVRGRAMAMVEAAAQSPSSKRRFAGIWRGRLVSCASASLLRAESRPDVQMGDYVLGMLRVPALHVTALWLRDGQGHGDLDLFIPLDPAPHEVPVGEPMDRVEFMQHLSRAKGSLLTRAVSGRPRERARHLYDDDPGLASR